jgi:hypothetical protein
MASKNFGYGCRLRLTKPLIPLATAKDIAFRGYDFILDLVDHLPKNAAAECNPGNPQMALAVLESECTYVCCAAYEAYAAWSKSRAVSILAEESRMIFG